MTRRKGRFSYVEQAAEPEKTEVLAVPSQPEQIVQQARGDAADALRHPDAYRLPAQQRGKGAAEGVQRRTDVPREQLNVRIRPELKRAAAGLAGLQGMTLGDVIEEALVEYIKTRQQ